MTEEESGRLVWGPTALRQGYARIPVRVLSGTDVSTGAKLLYVAVAAHLWGESVVAWPGQERLGEYCSASTRSIRRWTTELQEAQLLSVDQPQRGGELRYQLWVPSPESVAGGADSLSGGADSLSGGGADSLSGEVKEVRTEEKQLGRAREAKNNDEQPRPQPQRLDIDDTADSSDLQQNYPALRAECWNLDWPSHIQERWLQEIVFAMRSSADTWLADDDQAAAQLLRDNPPKGTEKNLPSKWLKRMEDDAPADEPWQKQPTRESDGGVDRISQEVQQELEQSQRNYEEYQRQQQQDQQEGVDEDD